MYISLVLLLLLLLFWNFFIAVAFASCVVLVSIRYQHMNGLTREEKGKTGRKQNQGRVEKVLNLSEYHLRGILSSSFLTFFLFPSFFWEKGNSNSTSLLGPKSTGSSYSWWCNLDWVLPFFYFVRRRKEKGYLDFESEFSLAFSSVWPMEDGVYVVEPTLFGIVISLDSCG